jgi:hypothetical protein
MTLIEPREDHLGTFVFSQQMILIKNTAIRFNGRQGLSVERLIIFQLKLFQNPDWVLRRLQYCGEKDNFETIFPASDNYNPVLFPFLTNT